MFRTRTSRAAAASIALAGMVGLSACQSNEVTTAPSTGSTSAPAPAAPTSQAPSTSQAPAAPSTTEAPAPSSTEAPSSAAPSSAAPSSASSAAPSGDAGDTTVTPAGTKLKFGEEAVIRESSTDESGDSYRLKVDALEVAPDSVYTGNLKKENGPVYFLKYTVTNIGKAGSSFDAGSVNSFMLTPKLQKGQEGKKLLGSIPQCESDDTELSVGQSGKGCDVYQVKGGSSIQEVTWAPGLRIQVTWGK